MKLKNKYDETVVNNYIDAESGELLDTEVQVKTHKIVVNDKEQFAFMYASIQAGIVDLNGVDIKLLIYCSLNCSYNSNMISLTAPYLAEISKIYSVSEGSLKNSIKRLVNLNILIRKGSGAYRINPKYYWKGEGSERIKTMKYILEIECPNC